MSEYDLFAEKDVHDCRDGCTGSTPALDRWNERTGHWYCPNGNDNCAAHARVLPPAVNEADDE